MTNALTLGLLMRLGLEFGSFVDRSISYRVRLNTHPFAISTSDRLIQYYGKDQQAQQKAACPGKTSC